MKNDRSLSEHISHLLKSTPSENTPGTQDELVQALSQNNISANQSSISRALRKLGAKKAVSSGGKAIYKIDHDIPGEQKEPEKLVLQVSFNDSLIVVRTRPGSASYVSYHLDLIFKDDILGTIAGDDTIFVAPKNISEVESCALKIREKLHSMF